MREYLQCHICADASMNLQISLKAIILTTVYLGRLVGLKTLSRLTLIAFKILENQTLLNINFFRDLQKVNKKLQKFTNLYLFFLGKYLLCEGSA